MIRTRVGFRGLVRSRARVEGFKGLGLGIGFRVWRVWRSIIKGLIIMRRGYMIGKLALMKEPWPLS